MKRYFLQSLLLYGLLAKASLAWGAEQEFNFSVIALPSATSSGTETALRETISETDIDNVAFVIANGIKSNAESCNDTLYNQRKALFENAKNGLIVSLAASDWSACKRGNGKSAAIERLNRLRELFFAEDFSFGTSKIPVVHQSSIAQFRSYAENTRWEIGDIVFATINLPGNNNHYLPDAGRNSEFEDRLIANRYWLQRIFTFATYKKLNGIVLFCDGDPLSTPNQAMLSRLNGKRDGFTEIRQQIAGLAAKFSGRVLVIHSTTPALPKQPADIVWQSNLGNLGVTSGLVRITVDASTPALFAVADDTIEAKNTHK